MSIRASYLYGDPADILDRKRAAEKREQQRKEQERIRKARRIRRLVAQAMKGIK